MSTERWLAARYLSSPATKASHVESRLLWVLNRDGQGSQDTGITLDHRENHAQYS